MISDWLKKQHLAGDANALCRMELENVELYRELFRQHSAVMLLIDAINGRIVDANNAAVRFYGYEANVLLDMHIGDINGMTREMAARVQHEVRSGFRDRLTASHRLASGDVRVVEVHSVPFVFFGREVLFSIIHDVTAHAEAQAALRQRDDQLALVLDGTDAALWEWHVPSDRVTYNKLLLRLVGMTEEQLGTTGNYWNTLIHPEDRERTVGLLQDSVDGRAQHFASEYRIATGSGGWLWVYGTGKVLERDAAGKAVRMAGLLMDVSLRRKAEDDRRRFFNLSPDLLCVAGFDGFFRELNPAWTRLLGWDMEELLASPWITFVYPDDRAMTLAVSDRLRRGESLPVVENRYRCKDGSWRRLSWKITVVEEEERFYAVARDVTELKEVADSLRRMSCTDPLTGVCNRACFMERVFREVERAQAGGHVIALLYVDIDHFKTINERYGHASGDAALCCIATTVRRCIRSADVVGRMGGEEFGVLLPSTSREEAHVVAERIRSGVEGATVGDDTPFGVTVSIGLVASPPLLSAERLFCVAEEALQKAKTAGRNRVAEVLTTIP